MLASSVSAIFKALRESECLSQIPLWPPPMCNQRPLLSRICSPLPRQVSLFCLYPLRTGDSTALCQQTSLLRAHSPLTACTRPAASLTSPAAHLLSDLLSDSASKQPSLQLCSPPAFALQRSARQVWEAHPFTSTRSLTHLLSSRRASQSHSPPCQRCCPELTHSLLCGIFSLASSPNILCILFILCIICCPH